MNAEYILAAIVFCCLLVFGLLAADCIGDEPNEERTYDTVSEITAHL